MPTRARSAAYWTTTILTAVSPCLGGGIGNLAHLEAQAKAMAELGYPAYVLTIIGVWKVLGGVAILVPRYPRLKEWAYAGLAFDLTGAAYSHAAVGDPAWKVLVPLVVLGIALASWALRPASRRLDAAPSAPAAADEGGAVTFARRDPSSA